MIILEEWKNKETLKYVCPCCKKEYSKKGISTHIMRTHTECERFSNSGTSGKTWVLGDNYISPRTIRKQEFLASRIITPCEKCGSIPKEWYGSGRFCSVECANSNTKTIEQKNHMSQKMKGRHRTKSSKISFCLFCNSCVAGTKKFCNRYCRSKYAQSHYTDLQLYRHYCKFKFSLNKYPEKYDFSLIEKYGWYKAKNRGDNQNGVSRDHIISVRYGFDNNIPTWIISHPANCQLMRHNDNVSKGTNISVTLDSLLDKIKHW